MVNIHEQFEEFLVRMELPQEARLALKAADKAFMGREERLEAVVGKYYLRGFSSGEISGELEELGAATGLPIYTVNAMFVIYASARMREDFKKRGIPEKIFWDTIQDLQYKLLECKKVKDIWGTFVLGWYGIFFQCNLFKLGRLEFERTSYHGEKYHKNGYTIEKGDTVYNVHIPSCGSLARGLRLDSYRRAFEFFRKERNGSPLFCTCYSWLMFKGNREIFSEKLNMVDFLNDWDITESAEAESFEDAWRVFSVDFDGDVSKLPKETAQQRALAEWLGAGKKTGNGLGIMVFDGEKIVN